MTTARILALTFVLASAVGAASAQTMPQCDQALADTHAAQLAGDIPHGDLDISAHNPGGDIHPAAGASVTLTRAQVKAELAAAITAGVVQVGEEGRTLAELEPARYLRVAEAAGLTREQVRAETLRAIRDGDVQQGETGLTLAQMFPQRYAAVRVRDGESRYAMN